MQSRVKDATIQLFVSANPQIHDGHALARLLDRLVPALVDEAAYSRLQGGACQHGLRLVGPHDACAHRGAEHGARMREQEEVGRIAQRHGKDARDETPQRREMGVEVGRRAYGGCEGAEGLGGGCGCVGRLRLEAAVPDGQQRPALGYAGSARNRAGRAGIEVIVERLDCVWVPIGGQDIGQGGAGERGERETEEDMEGREL